MTINWDASTLTAHVTIMTNVQLTRAWKESMSTNVSTNQSTVMTATPALLTHVIRKPVSASTLIRCVKCLMITPGRSVWRLSVISTMGCAGSSPRWGSRLGFGGERDASGAVVGVVVERLCG